MAKGRGSRPSEFVTAAVVSRTQAGLCPYCGSEMTPLLRGGRSIKAEGKVPSQWVKDGVLMGCTACIRGKRIARIG